MRGSSSRALWRLRPYLRPYATQLATMVVVSFMAIAAALAVPLVICGIVDGPIARGDRDALHPLAGLVLLFGLIEAGSAFTRRWIQGAAANGFERSLREDIHAHLQSLPPAFHDRWHSGQLLSRAMADLSVVRRFVGVRPGLPDREQRHLRAGDRPAVPHVTAAGPGDCGVDPAPGLPRRDSAGAIRPCHAGCRTSRATSPHSSRRRPPASGSSRRSDGRRSSVGSTPPPTGCGRRPSRAPTCGPRSGR